MSKISYDHRAIPIKRVSLYTLMEAIALIGGVEGPAMVAFALSACGHGQRHRGGLIFSSARLMPPSAAAAARVPGKRAFSVA